MNNDEKIKELVKIYDGIYAKYVASLALQRELVEALKRNLERMKLINGPNEKCIGDPSLCFNHQLYPRYRGPHHTRLKGAGMTPEERAEKIAEHFINVHGYINIREWLIDKFAAAIREAVESDRKNALNVSGFCQKARAAAFEEAAKIVDNGGGMCDCGNIDGHEAAKEIRAKATEAI